MKKILLLVALVSVAMTSCYEDKGVYDYTPMEGVDLQPIIDEVVFGNAQINAEYEVEVPVPAEVAEEYDFHWEYVPDKADAVLTGKVCEGTDLVLTPKQMGEMTLYFVATHKKMKTEYYAEKTITVAPICAKGWLLLGRKGTESTLSFAEPASSSSSKSWKTYNNFATGLSGDAQQVQMQYAEYTAGATSNTASDDVGIWVVGPSLTAAYTNESFELRTTLEDNRTGVVAGDDITNWKKLIAMNTAAFILEESGNVYMKYAPSLYGKFSSSPVEYNNVPYAVEEMVYCDYDDMPTSKNTGFFAILTIGKDGKLKWIDATESSYKGNVYAGKVRDFNSFIDINGEEMTEEPDLSGAELIAGTYYFSENPGSDWWDIHYVNLILKRGSDYSMASFIGDAHEIELTNYQEFALDNSAGYLTGEKIDLVTGGNGDGSFSYFKSGSNLCIINTKGEIIKLYTAEDEIAAIDVNPQKTEVGLALAGGKFVILNVEDLAAPQIVHEMQYDVDSFVDLTYKYTSLDTAMEPEENAD